MIYNVAPTSAGQQSDPVMHTYTCVLFPILSSVPVYPRRLDRGPVLYSRTPLLLHASVFPSASIHFSWEMPRASLILLLLSHVILVACLPNAAGGFVLLWEAESSVINTELLFRPTFPAATPREVLGSCENYIMKLDFKYLFLTIDIIINKMSINYS